LNSSDWCCEMKRISVVPERCSGCRICELACAQYHFGVNNPKKAAIRIFSLYPNPVIRSPVVCHQCDDPDCQRACPSDAIERVNGILTISRDLCTGCLICVDACPYGALFVHPEVSTPIMCDLCSGFPRCVAACPKQALQPVDELGEQPYLSGGTLKYAGMKEIPIDETGEVLKYNDGGESE